MKDIHIDQREEEILNFEVSDEALEAAAGTEGEGRRLHARVLLRLGYLPGLIGSGTGLRLLDF